MLFKGWQTRKVMGESEARTLLLEAIEGSLQQPLQAQQLSEIPRDLQRPIEARRTWWNHVRDRFFLGDDDLMLRELRIDRNAFEDIVNAVADLPLHRRGRRAFVFSHRERVLFLHAFLAFGLHVAHMLLLPIIMSIPKSPPSPNGSPPSTQTECVPCS